MSWDSPFWFAHNRPTSDLPSEINVHLQISFCHLKAKEHGHPTNQTWKKQLELSSRWPLKLFRAAKTRLQIEMASSVDCLVATKSFPKSANIHDGHDEHMTSNLTLKCFKLVLVIRSYKSTNMREKKNLRKPAARLVSDSNRFNKIVFRLVSL